MTDPRKRKLGRTGLQVHDGRIRVESITPMEFILRFTFAHPDMATNIVGTINTPHLQNNIDLRVQM